MTYSPGDKVWIVIPFDDPKEVTFIRYNTIYDDYQEVPVIDVAYPGIKNFINENGSPDFKKDIIEDRVSPYQVFPSRKDAIQSIIAGLNYQKDNLMQDVKILDKQIVSWKSKL